MQVTTTDDPDQALTVVFTRDEVPVFRAALERAMFSDTPPHLQSAVLDLVHRLVEQVQD